MTQGVPRYLDPMAQEIPIGPMTARFMGPIGSRKSLTNPGAHMNRPLTGSYRALTSPQEYTAWTLPRYEAPLGIL